MASPTRMRRRCGSRQYRCASRKPESGSPPNTPSWRPYTPPTDGSSKGAVRWLSQSPFPGRTCWLRKTTTSPRVSSIARFQLRGPAGSAISTKRARANWLTMWRVPSVEPESAQTISSGVRPWPMMRCKTVPKARPGLSVGMTIETEKPPSPITACNERRKPFQPAWLGEPHSDVVKIGGRRAITRADAEDLNPALRPRRRPREADAHIEVHEVRLDGRGGGGRPSQLGAARIEHDCDDRPLVHARGARHLDWRADPGVGIRTVDDDLASFRNGRRGRGGQGGAGR